MNPKLWGMDLRDIMLVVLMVVILSMVVIFVFATQDGQECLVNPLAYGLNKAYMPFDPSNYGSGTGKVYGVLTFENPSYRPIYFDNETISTFSPQERAEHDNPINWSDLNLNS